MSVIVLERTFRDLGRIVGGLHVLDTGLKPSTCVCRLVAIARPDGSRAAVLMRRPDERRVVAVRSASWFLFRLY